MLLSLKYLGGLILGHKGTDSLPLPWPEQPKHSNRINLFIRNISGQKNGRVLEHLDQLGIKWGIFRRSEEIAEWAFFV